MHACPHDLFSLLFSLLFFKKEKVCRRLMYKDGLLNGFFVDKPSNWAPDRTYFVDIIKSSKSR
jgi:hypothetical protein